MTDAQMQTNALYVASEMRKKGWTDNAIAGLLGNMESESNINPGLWQSRDEGNTSGGFGLTQWTPASKFLNWVSKYNMGEIWDMDVQLTRIEREFLYPGSTSEYEQWYSTDEYPVSASAYINSTADPAYLGRAFVRNYERPWSILYGDDATRQRVYNLRGSDSAKWYKYITNHEWVDPDPGNPDEPEPPVPAQKKAGFDLMMWLCTRRRGKYVVR